MTAPILDAGTVRDLVGAAAAAPSIHNTQPWRFRVGAGGALIELHAAPERLLVHTDPDGRALHVSAGAALFNVRCAMTRTGRRPAVRLRPDPGSPDLLATVAPADPAGSGDPLGGPLYAAIPHRHSSRRPYAQGRPPEAVLRALRDAARAEGAQLYLPDEDGEISRLRHLVAEAEARDRGDRERREESRRWVREAGDDGVPPAALGPQDAQGYLPVRSFAPGPEHRLAPEPFESAPCLAVLLTRHDTPDDWLAAGQALERVLLLATAEGLVASMLHQPLEWHDLRWQVRDPRLGPGYPQMLLRLGHGPSGPATPRRPVEDVLDEPEH